MKAHNLYMFALASVLNLTGCHSNISSGLSSYVEDESVQSNSFGENSPLESTESVPESLKILSIGNSFAVDTNEHLPNIALNLGVRKIKVATL